VFIPTETLIVLAEPTTQTGDSSTATIALYGMISALGVAIIGFLAQIVLARITNKADKERRRSRTTSKEHEAWERWLLLQDVDPRKIITGYESYDDVKKV
jgi:hypothetical protein